MSVWAVGRGGRNEEERGKRKEERGKRKEEAKLMWVVGLAYLHNTRTYPQSHTDSVICQMAVPINIEGSMNRSS